jgi:hypothetical protein
MKGKGTSTRRRKRRRRNTEKRSTKRGEESTAAAVAIQHPVMPLLPVMNQVRDLILNDRRLMLALVTQVSLLNKKTPMLAMLFQVRLLTLNNKIRMQWRRTNQQHLQK